MISKAGGSVLFPSFQNVALRKICFVKIDLMFSLFDVIESENSKSYECALLSVCRDDLCRALSEGLVIQMQISSAHSGKLYLDMFINIYI